MGLDCCVFSAKWAVRVADDLVALGALFLGERITRDKVLWLVLAFAGMLAITQAHDTPVYGQAGGYLAGMRLGWSWPARGRGRAPRL